LTAPQGAQAAEIAAVLAIAFTERAKAATPPGGKPSDGPQRLRRENAIWPCDDGQS